MLYPVELWGREVLCLEQDEIERKRRPTRASAQPSRRSQGGHRSYGVSGETMRLLYPLTIEDDLFEQGLARLDLALRPQR